MYYLNDKHSKYEYALYCRVGNACPYIARIFNSIDEVYRYANEIEKRHNHYRQFFYIDNDFYNNNYNLNSNGTYYKFLRRPVSDWEDNWEETTEKSLNNILYFYR